MGHFPPKILASTYKLDWTSYLLETIFQFICDDEKLNFLFIFCASILNEAKKRKIIRMEKMKGFTLKIFVKRIRQSVFF